MHVGCIVDQPVASVAKHTSVHEAPFGVDCANAQPSSAP
jgi:hypothetical protein